MYNEATIQTAVVAYIKLQYPEVRYCASLGGIRTGIKQAKKAKATGYVAGVPDLQIMEAKGGYFGLFVEIKFNKKCYPSLPQRNWIKDLNVRGYKAVVTKGFDETIEAIDDYLSEKATRTLRQAPARVNSNK